jgi:transglutaminase-like putative cysteine protease
MLMATRVAAPTSSLSLRVRVGCEFEFDSEMAFPSVFQVQPHPQGNHRVLEESWESDPVAEYEDYLDPFGNHCRRQVISEGRMRIRYDGVVETSGVPDAADQGAEQVPHDQLPDETLQFLLPSRYCLPDVLGGVALDLFGDIEPGWAQVDAISRWVHEHITYTIGSTNTLSDATDAYLMRRGVCRDYAHLAISLCRAFNYPARYAFGYLPLMDRPLPEEGMDFAAYMEVYIGGEWYTFDPRNDARLAGRVLVGRGRDAVDVAMVTSAGAPRLVSMTVRAET